MDSQNKVKSENIYHLALILSKKISIGTNSGNEKLSKLLLEYNSFENICKNEWENLFGFEDNMKKEIPTLEKKIKEIEKISFDYNLITIVDKEYPDYLKKISGNSPVFYYRGNLDLLKQEKTIAVVGTRKPNEIGINEGNNLIKRLVDNNYIIVSGLAMGCDTLAHKKTIENNGNTIAVLGTPINKYSSKENRELQDEIAKNHLLISQYPIGIQTYPSHFANRNINTVGLSKDGVVIIQAMDKSGTMYAIKESVKYKKNLFVLKNNLENNQNWIKKYQKEIKVV